MPQNPTDSTAADNLSAAAFIQRWRGVNASELSTAQSFVIGLCDWLGVPPPHATPEQDYLFERPVTFLHGNGSSSAGRIDCSKTAWSACCAPCTTKSMPPCCKPMAAAI